MLDTRLASRTALVTGAGSGIGRAIAVGMAAAGAEVLSLDVDEERSAQTVAAVREAGGQARALACDVTDEAAVADAVGAIAKIDVLCNNVGVIDDFALADEMTLDMWERVLRINLTGQFLMCRAALPGMLDRGCGAIINIASEAGLRGGAAGVAYTASKHGVVGLTRNLAYTYRERGIRTNAICPGGVRETSISSSADIDRGGLALLAPVRAVIGDAYGTPDQVAAVAVFLASDAASFVNGAIIPVDAGWSAG